MSPLDDCFLAGGAVAWLEPGSSRLDPPRAGHLAVMITLQGRLRVARMAGWIAMPWRIWRAERTLVRAGATPIGRYGAWPDTRRPTFVYPLASTAAAYAESQFLPPPNRALRWLRQAVRPLALCHPSLAAVIVLGKVP
jgi:hypothetical protein